MVNVRCRGPVLAGKVVRVRRERAEAVRIALSAIEHVGAGQEMFGLILAFTFVINWCWL